MSRHNTIRGSAVAWLIIGLVVVLLAGVALIVARRQASSGTDTPSSSKKSPAKQTQQVGQQLSNGKCNGSGPGTLTHSAMDEQDFTYIIPYGLMVGGHVTPIDHQYYAPADYQSPRDAYPVYAMGDARLVAIQHRVQSGGDNKTTRERITDEYRLVFTQTCTFFYYYDLVTSLTPEIKAEFDKQAKGELNTAVDIPVNAGQLIGRIGGQTLDFAVWDLEKPLKGFVVPEHYNAEIWKLYTADPLDYYTPDLKVLMLARYPRMDEPLSGKIDWDLDGKLRGNWFLAGTNGYEGQRDNPKGYWTSHLSFSPDLYDNSHFLISMGDFGGEAIQYNVKGNAPDPAIVGIESGVVKYELIQGEHVAPSGQPWDRRSFVKGLKVVEGTPPVRGVVLVQLTDARTLKFEAFPGKTKAEVSGFTAAAKTYTR